VRSSAPECERKGRYRLARDLKVVLEGLFGNERTLRDKGWTVIVICMLLEETVPML
jgi:hypothetical protein